MDPRAEGCNRLIRDGANLLLSSMDVIDVLSAQGATSRNVEPLPQKRVVGVLADGVFVMGQGLAPPALLLQLLTAAQQIGDVAARIGDRDRGWKLCGRRRAKP